MLAISVDPPDVSEKLRQRLDLPMRLLSDPDGTLMDALGVRHRDALPPAVVTGADAAGRTSRDLFMSTTFLLDETHTIRWIYRPETYRVRAPAAEVVRRIRALG